MTPKAKLTAAVIAIALATTALIPAAAMAQGMRSAMPSFQELDVNRDGQINRADLTARADARFAAADTNGNGTLSEAELNAQAQARAVDRAAQRVTRMLNRMDADGDGALSHEEMQAHGQGRRGGGNLGERMLKRADTDGDGAVSESEYIVAQERMAERGGPDERHGQGEKHRRN